MSGLFGTTVPAARPSRGSLRPAHSAGAWTGLMGKIPLKLWQQWAIRPFEAAH